MEAATTDAAWTVEQAAEYLGVAEKTLYKWAAEGVVPSMKVGHLRRFSPRALAEWRQARTHGGEG